MSEHAFLAPSSAAVWVRCAAAPSMAALYPEREDSVEAMEGTAAHWAAFEEAEERDAAVGQIAPNGIMLTQEMVEGAEMWADVVKPLRFNGHISAFEQRVAINGIHSKNWGTPDGWAYFGGAPATLDVLDYKFGHEYVEVFENWQLLDYTNGIIAELLIPEAMKMALKVRFTIVQPRSYHRDGPVRTWTTTGAALLVYWNTLRKAAEAATAPDAMQRATPDPKACKHCSGRHACEALQRVAYAGAEAAASAGPLDLPPHALGLELRTLHRAQALLNARVTGLEEQAQDLARGGKDVPFFRMEPGQSRLQWIKPIEEIVVLGQLCSVDLAKPGVVTPTQALKAGIMPELIDAYAGRAPAAMKLVADDGSQARKVFSLTKE